MTKTIAVLVPTCKPTAKEIPIAPRVHDLNDKVVGFIWNSKPNGDILLLRIKEQLSQRFRLAGTNWHQSFIDLGRDYSRVPAEATAIARISDLVINGQGD